MTPPTTHIALFASGNGTNVQRICEYFAGNGRIRPVVLFCDNPKAGVLERAANLELPVVLIDRKKLADRTFMTEALHRHQVNALVLAGFL